MTSKAKSQSATAPTASAAPAGAGVVVTAPSATASANASTFVSFPPALAPLDDALRDLTLSDADALSLPLPSLTANPHTPFVPFTAASASDSFGVGGDGEVYRSLGAGADTLGEAPVFRSVGSAVGSGHYEDTGSFVTASGAGGSGLHHAHGHGHGMSVVANPFQPISLASEMGLKKAVGGSGSGGGAAVYSMQLQLNPKVHGAFDSHSSSASDDVLPPEVPGYLEPAFHFALAPALRATDFFGVLLPLLAAARVDFSAPVLSADRACKVKCVAYGGGASAGVGRVPFVVSVFRLDKSGQRLVVEFQRRSGCVMTFCTLYRNVRRELQQKGALLVTLPATNTLATTTTATATGTAANANADSNVAPAAVSRFTEVSVLPTPADLPAVEGSEVSSERAKKAVEMLLGMVASEFTDVKVKAIQMLADLTAVDAADGSTNAAGAAAYCQALACSGANGADGSLSASVLKCLTHGNEDVQRCAITTIANVTSVKRVALCTAVVASAEFAAVSGVVSQTNTSSVSAQTTREAARALANIADTIGFGGAAGLSAHTVRSAVNALNASTDAVVRLHAGRITHALNAAGHTTSSSTSTSTSTSSSSSQTTKAFALPQDLTLPTLALSRQSPSK